MIKLSWMMIHFLQMCFCFPKTLSTSVRTSTKLQQTGYPITLHKGI